VAGIQWADERQDGVKDSLPAGDQREIEMEVFAGGPEVEDAIFGESGSEGIGVGVVEAESVTMKGVGDFVTFVGELGEVVAHG